jgi:hypothetical protein
MVRDLTLSIFVAVSFIVAAHIFVWGLTAFPPARAQMMNLAEP